MGSFINKIWPFSKIYKQKVELEELRFKLWVADSRLCLKDIETTFLTSHLEEANSKLQQYENSQSSSSYISETSRVPSSVINP